LRHRRATGGDQRSRIFSVTNGFTLDSKRGIAVGQHGSGSGTISVASGEFP
jgi:hypothetical protein